MQLVLLSGGSGQRLWPLSNETRSKQFLPLLSDGNGNYLSMIQRIVRQITESGITDNILIATNKKQRDIVTSQLGNKVEIVTEPERRDTFPAIALAACYLNFVKKCNDNEIVVVMPCDPYVEPEYFSTIKTMAECCENNVAKLILMGIKPTYPAEKFGYILPGKQLDCGNLVEQFIEKPPKSVAEALLSKNALWNGGVFAFQLGYINELITQYLNPQSYDDAIAGYSKFPKISFDYEVVEHADSIVAVPYNGKWKDLGTWTSLLSEIKDTKIGKAIISDNCRNTKVINELNIPVLCSGISDAAVITSYDGILVLNNDSTENLKPYVERLATRPLYEERRWGIYKVIDQQKFDNGICQLTKQITIKPGKSISYQLHHHRDEIWTIVDGNGQFVLNGRKQSVKTGDVLKIEAGQKHAIKADNTLTLIEVQLGSKLEEADVERFDFEW